MLYCTIHRITSSNKLTLIFGLVVISIQLELIRLSIKEAASCIDMSSSIRFKGAGPVCSCLFCGKKTDKHSQEYLQSPLIIKIII